MILAMRRWDEAAKAISPHCYDDYHYFYCCYMLLLHPLVLRDDIYGVPFWHASLGCRVQGLGRLWPNSL